MWLSLKMRGTIALSDYSFEVSGEMIQTLDFIRQVWMSETLQERLLENMESRKEDKIVIGIRCLEFDFERRMVTISCCDPEYLFKFKMPSVEMTFHSLEQFIHQQFTFDFHII